MILSPVVGDANFANMIRSSVYGQDFTINIGILPMVQYQAYLYVWEDNSATTYSLAVHKLPPERADRKASRPN